MFEKEAEKKYCKGCKLRMEQCLWAWRNTNGLNEPNEKNCSCKEVPAYIAGFQDGYNKANEWHYMKDVNCYEDLHFPPEEEEKGRVLIWKVQTEKGIKRSVCYHCGSYGDLWYEINAYHVIEWKEILLPKEIE